MLLAMVSRWVKVFGSLRLLDEMNCTKSHDESVIEMLRSDPEFAREYLHAAFEALNEDGGDAGLLTALRHMVEANGGMAVVSEKAGLSRESLYRALSLKGNPTLRTMKKIIHAVE